MKIPNRIKKQFEPYDYQTMIDGKPVKISDLSRDDLMQIACENMNTMDTFETLQQELVEVTDRWRSGRPQKTLTEIGKRIIADDPDGPSE
jgi:hypothetical protein